MNASIVCVAVALACSLASTTAFAQSESINIPSSATAVSSTVSIAIAGLRANSMTAIPGYPLKAYRDGHRQGRVLIGYTVNADGTVSDVQVVDAFPVQVFTRTATNAVAGWRFLPSGTTERRNVEFQFNAD